MRKILVIVLCVACSVATYAQLNTDRVLAIGRNALYFEDYVLSIQYFNQIIKVKPYLTEPYFYRAVAKIQLEDYQGAEQDCNAVIERNTFMPQAYYARGFVRMHLDRYAEAEADFRQALEFSPENTTYTLMLVEACVQQAKYADALAGIESLQRRNQHSFDLLYERGRILFEQGDSIAALHTFDELVQTHKHNPDAWSARAIVKLQMDDTDGALADYNQAIALGTRNAGCYINRGILNYELKNYRGALADYDQAIALDPTDETARFNRALLRAEVGDLNNALDDLNEVLKHRPDYDKAIYQRAIINSELYDWQAAIDDFTAIINRYPTFAPAYHGRAQANEKLGKKRAAFDDYERIEQLRQAAKNNQKNDQSNVLNTQPDVAHDDSPTQARTRLFAADNSTGNAIDNVRGSIQNTYMDVSSEKNFVLSYYQKADLVRKDEHYSQAVNDLNAKRLLPGAIKIVNREMPLTQTLINYHFRSIDEYSQRIVAHPDNAYLYLARGIDYALVQDFSNALADFSNAIYLDSDLALAYFCRANIRFKALEIKVNDLAADNVGTESGMSDKQYAYDFEMIMRDYDRTLELLPDFAFAWFNRANVLCVQKDYQSAIRNYTNAIACNTDFAEAYFNRGLAYIYIGDTQNGISDLSKAGELGIYQAYNYLKRIRN